MPSVVVSRLPPRLNAPSASSGTHPKLVLYSEDKKNHVEIPYAPNEVNFTKMAATYATIPRPGRTPLVLRSGDSLPVMSMDCWVGHRDINQSIELFLHDIRVLATGNQRVFMAFGYQSNGLWFITNMGVTTERRQFGTNEITRAKVSLEFTLAGTYNAYNGPVSGGHKKDPGSAGPKSLTRTHVVKYTVRRGDTLTSIAGHVLKNTTRYKEIARDNNIRNPRSIKVGQVLNIRTP